MVTVEKVNEIVSNRGDGISQVKIHPKGYRLCRNDGIEVCCVS
jgi:hypothetical protein